MGALREVDCNGPGISRIGAGRGFFYRDATGARVEDAEVLDRIKALAIPPAWREVWICSDPDGHIQAVGIDARGRRQYRYHDRWSARQARKKHERVLHFARRLPGLRDQVERDLAEEGMGRDRVLACAVRLLELGFFRVGGEAYAKENDSYGLATLQRQHVRVRGDAILFDYDAKGGRRRRHRVLDPEVIDVITALRRRRTPPDADLLAYRDGGEWVDVRSDDINAYLKVHLGDDFSAKDFRTWVGTVAAATALAGEDAPRSAADRRAAVARAVDQVADQLGNTPAVARSAYIDPRVVERFQEDVTIEEPDASTDLEVVEADVIGLVTGR